MGACVSGQDHEERIQRYEMQHRQLVQQVQVEKARVQTLDASFRFSRKEKTTGNAAQAAIVFKKLPHFILN
jgi:hypothetical protein